MNEYTTTAYWDKVWEDEKLQDLVEQGIIEQGINTEILKIISPGLFKGAKVLEIGCVPAGRLYFLQKHLLFFPKIFHIKLKACDDQNKV